MEGSGEQVERVNQECLSILDDSFADLSIEAEVSLTTAATPLRELCHDLIEPAATIRWLVRVAAIESGQDQRNRLDAIAVAAAQIAAICENVLDWPQRGTAARLDVLAGDAAASAHVRYAGVINVVSQPVTALVPAGDIVRILGNVLANACRAAGPAGFACSSTRPTARPGWRSPIRVAASAGRRPPAGRASGSASSVRSR